PCRSAPWPLPGAPASHAHEPSKCWPTPSACARWRNPRPTKPEAMSELAAVPVTAIKGVGAALAEQLAKVGLESLQDLLFHLPLRYQDRTRIVPIGALRPGQDAVIEGTVTGADVVMGRRRSLLVRLHDGSGSLSLRFY